MGEKKTLMEGVSDIEEYLLKEGFNGSEALMILRELETTAITATILQALNVLSEPDDDKRQDQQEHK